MGWLAKEVSERRVGNRSFACSRVRAPYLADPLLGPFAKGAIDGDRTLWVPGNARDVALPVQRHASTTILPDTWEHSLGSAYTCRRTHVCAASQLFPNPIASEPSQRDILRTWCLISKTRIEHSDASVSIHYLDRMAGRGFALPQSIET